MQAILEFIRLLWDQFLQLIDIKKGVDYEGTLVRVRENVKLRGFNFWLLGSGAMLASIGLDLNSTAVIIGAMLVSPLMSPILGVGMGIAVYDRKLLTASLVDMVWSTVISLTVSVLYFLITPFGEVTDEITARTQPTLLDALVAFFGGVAGIVASSRVDKGPAAIPGVAIATALMPPLCTSGFGIANGDLNIALGAFYLYFLNFTLICFSTFLLVVFFLEFPHVEFTSKQMKQRYLRYILIVVTIVSVPSIIFLVNIAINISNENQVEAIINEHIESDRHQVIDVKHLSRDTLTEVRVYVVGERYPQDTLDVFNQMLRERGLNQYRFNIVQIDMADSKDLENKKMVEALTTLAQARESFSTYQRKEAEEQAQTQATLLDLHYEIELLFPDCQEIRVGKLAYVRADTSDTLSRQPPPLVVDTLTTVFTRWKPAQQPKAREDELMTFRRLLAYKLPVDTFELRVEINRE